jgi:hypothetical protein
MKTFNFPKQIIMQVENQGKEDEFLNPCKSLSEMNLDNEKATVGIYALIMTQEVENKTTTI